MHIFTFSMSRRVKPALCLFLSAALVASLMSAVFSVNSGVLSAQTSAGNLNNGGGLPNSNTLVQTNWDTDNLDFANSTITAGSFGVPSFSYSGGHDACVAGAPGFYQTPGSDGGVNDFPIAGDYSQNVTWNATNPCAVFASEQDRLKDTIEDGKLFHAVFEGGQWTVRSVTDPGWFQNRDASLTYGTWAANTVGSQNVGNCSTAVSANGYGARSDYTTLPVGSEPFLAAYDTGTGSGSTRQLGIPFSIQISSSGGVNLSLQRCARVDVFTPHFLTVADSVLCAAGSHPRGEDAALGGYPGSNLVVSGSGRTLTSLSTVDRLKMANRFWCRSDVRYDRVFEGTAVEGAAEIGFSAYFGGSQSVQPQSGSFRGWGRMNCYHTALGVGFDTITVGGVPFDDVPVCVYVFPLPACAAGLTGAELDLWVGRPVSELTALEVEGSGCMPPDEEEEEIEDEEEEEEEEYHGFVEPPGERPDISGEPCRKFDFEVRENIPAEDNVLPGLAMRYDTDLAGHELASVAPHALTASPPRRVGDSAGCADGVEIRSDHSDTERKRQGSGGAPTVSVSGLVSDSVYPPGALELGSGGMEVRSGRYDAARTNFAHRTASWVAENECAAKAAEGAYLRQFARVQINAAKAQIETFKAEAERVADEWERYDADVAEAAGSGFLQGLGNLNRAAREKYANKKKELATAVASAASMAIASLEDVLTEAVDKTPRVPTTMSAGCVQSWEDHIDTIRTNYDSALTDARPALVDAVKAYEDENDNKLRLIRHAVNDTPPTTGLPLGDGPAATHKTVSEPTGIIDWVCKEGFDLDEDTRPRRCEKGDEEISPTRVERMREEKECSRTSSGSYTYTNTASYADPDKDEKAPTIRRTDRVSATRSYTKNVELDAECPGWSDMDMWMTTEMPGIWTPTDLGEEGTVRDLPTGLGLTAPAAFKFDVLDPDRRDMDRRTILGAYHPGAGRRSEMSSLVGGIRDRATAAVAGSIASMTGFPAGLFEMLADVGGDETSGNLVRAYQDGYKTAYGSAVDRVSNDLGGADIEKWEGLGWAYTPGILRWVDYKTDPEGPCSVSKPAGDPRDLLSVTAAGEVKVRALRLDYETGQVNGQVPAGGWPVECNIIRERTPVLELEYEPDWEDDLGWRMVSGGLDSTNLGVVDYGTQTLRQEYDMVGLNIRLADAEPVLCHSSYPSSAGHTTFRVATAGGAGIDVLRTATATGANIGTAWRHLPKTLFFSYSIST